MLFVMKIHIKVYKWTVFDMCITEVKNITLSIGINKSHRYSIDSKYLVSSFTGYNYCNIS